ncbi:hypothetical protein SAMN05216369_0749 [Marinobacter antarcticus]|uniref:Uncharacterized protein n=1 Tax=Marinobacter antarcticus TaxID=564117 RepID=A0A1M6Q8R1_9GAMM|nr:hypothetical protein SAMN05216369_0749 [Marinobacter antarcticus]
METILVNTGGLVLMASIVWWFWLSSSDTDAAAQDQSDH